MKLLLSMLATAITVVSKNQQDGGLRIGLISDLHLHLNYNSHWGPYVDREGGCIKNSGTKQSDTAPMGRYGCDTPAVLIETMLEELDSSHGDLDVIIMTGDYVGH